MDIQELLDTIKPKALKAIKEEFKELLDAAKKDKSDFIKRSAEQVKQALIYRAEGKLSADDVATLLKKQKKMAQIEANNVQIQTLSRIQKISYRILDIAIDVVLKAIVPIA
jgi:phosphoribosyl-ATP pyrophosphohydrolase